MGNFLPTAQASPSSLSWLCTTPTSTRRFSTASSPSTSMTASRLSTSGSVAPKRIFAASAAHLQRRQVATSPRTSPSGIMMDPRPIKPRAVFKDPFRPGDNILVLCDTYTPAGVPLPTNTRNASNAIMEKAKDLEPWFGLEQEYTLFEADFKTPLGWPPSGFPAPQGPYYRGMGANSSYGRHIVEAHYRACLYAGIKISGVNAEVMPGQWEYQVGPCVGTESGDQLWISRFLMLRVCELFRVNVSWDPKPIEGDWNGAGCHTNFSTKPMREEGGYAEIIKACEALGAPGVPEAHIAAYGAGNERRLTGKHETASINEYSYGVANRGASIRIPSTAEKDGKGYLEDRRPSSNMDPYRVNAMMVKTCCGV